MRNVGLVIAAGIICFASFFLVACASGSSPEEDVTNPLVEADGLQDFQDQMGIGMSIPENAQATSFSMYRGDDGELQIAEVNYTLDGLEYCQRMKKTNALEDISGMYFDWTTVENIKIKDTKTCAGYIASCQLSYNEGVEGLVCWYDKTDGISCSISMNTGASEDTLVAAIQGVFDATLQTSSTVYPDSSVSTNTTTSSSTTTDTNTAAASSTTTTSVSQTISPESLKASLDAGETITVVDVRTQAEYDAGHIPGATLLTLDTIGDRATTVLPDKSMKIVVYCRTGVRSAKAVKTLVGMGYTNVFDLTGGITDWSYETVE